MTAPGPTEAMRVPPYQTEALPLTMMYATRPTVPSVMNSSPASMGTFDIIRWTDARSFFVSPEKMGMLLKAYSRGDCLGMWAFR
jgi:hypothetical protein